MDYRCESPQLLGVLLPRSPGVVLLGVVLLGLLLLGLLPLPLP